MLATATTIDLSYFHLSHSSSSFYLWHSRLGHVLFSCFNFLASTGALAKLQTHDGCWWVFSFSV